MERLGPAGLGRGQVRRHPRPAPRHGREVRLYSRDLHDISGQFPEVVAAAAELPWDGILDGEILAWRDGVVLPFIALQTRLGRKEPSAAMLAEVPVIFVAFDVLALGQPTATAGSSRCCASRSTSGAGGSSAGPATRPRRAAASPCRTSVRRRLDRRPRGAFAAARARRNEGLMVKDPQSVYSPGRRGLGWLKMKKALATLDCVVVGVEVGHGKRHGVLSDYTFAVRDTEDDRLVTIGKAYSGLTDAEIAEMTRWFEEHTIARFGRYRLVEPTVVVEVAFDVIVRSQPPRVRLRAALPAHRRTCGRTRRPTRSTRSRPSTRCTRGSSTAPSTW